MPIEKIEFGNQQQSSIEPLGGASPIAMNVITDPLGSVRRRPGITTYSRATSSVIDSNGIAGIYITEGSDVYAVSAAAPGSNVYAVTATSAANLSNPGNRVVPGSGRPVFAETEMIVTVCCGSTIKKIILASKLIEDLGGSPPTSTHVIANSSRLLANDTAVDRTKVRYSSTAIGTVSYSGLETWFPAVTNTAGYFTAEARPDPVVAIAENTNEVFVWGSDTLQVYDPDPSLIFAPGATREVGCAAPYSIIKRDQEFYWLDHLRRFVHSDGRSFEVISDPIKGDLDSMVVVSDAYGYRVLTGNCDALVWSFPNEGRTFTFQVGAGWGQWSGWSDTRNDWAPFAVLSHHLENTSGQNVVGTTDGRIGALSTTATTDLGQRINAYVQTGFVSHGSDIRKQCVSMRLTLRRGQTTGQGEPKALLSWRDDLGAWESPIEISLGRSGETAPVVELRSLGVYRRRQWKFQFDGSDELVLVSATEEFQVLDN